MSMIQEKSANYTNRVNLSVGEVYFADKPSVIWTVLGSCVSVVFHNAETQIGAICHAQLPRQDLPNMVCNKSCPIKCMKEQPASNLFKFVSCSINNMIKKFETKGISPKQIHVKVFGGANVIPSANPDLSVGKKKY